MKCFAQTAEDDQGNRLPEDKWQPLPEHLRNVALLAKEFATPLGLAVTENRLIPAFLKMGFNQPQSMYGY